ncbi:uncharacterized protein EAF01_000318 [Botrytis porri]|uniref:uncharacterized protein n=1 Tax=Botrytis porri TaxID=87229 RepID=UPI001901301D|nr:uncharacterized protein EAF01_000318 [Botrytis porri]KAF7913912.1 hypothetical protein EAF01_000318 [Botrytis porri]
MQCYAMLCYAMQCDMMLLVCHVVWYTLGYSSDGMDASKNCPIFLGDGDGVGVGVGGYEEGGMV